MDPISIATASVHLVGACAKLSGYIYTFVKQSQTVDTAVHVLDIEIKSLSDVLGSIATSFSDPLVASVALEAQTGHEGQYWKTVKTSMDDCKGTLANLEQILEKVGKQEAGSFFGRSRKHIKLSMNLGEIDLLKQQVAAYRQTMQLALQMITVSSGLSSHADISWKLESLTGNVDRLLRSFLLLNQNLTQGGSQDRKAELVMNLETCVRSAGKLVSSATTLVSRNSQKGSQFGSDFGDELTDQKKSQIESWIPEPTIYEEIEEQNLDHVPVSTRPSTPPPAPAPITSKLPNRNPVARPVPTITKPFAEMTIKDTLPNDIDYDLIESLFTSAKKKFSDKDYVGAEQVIQRIVARANVTYSSHWKWRDELLKILAVIYCELKMWEKASEVLDQEFEGRDEEIKSRAEEWCFQNQCGAVKVLLTKKFEGREKIMELYAKRVYWNEQWDEAGEVLRELLNTRTLELDRLRITQALAEVAFARGAARIMFDNTVREEKNIDTARELCLTALYGRKKILGNAHVLYYQSINLLVLIYNAQGDSVEAEGYKALLPADFDECTLIERLDRKPPEQVGSDKLNATLFNDVFPEYQVELQQNFSRGGVTGSGMGRTLLHKYLNLGLLLPAQLLLEKGMDPNAKDGYGYTSLHCVICYRPYSESAEETIINTLLEKGAGVNETTPGGTTVLMWACQKARPAIVQLLVDRGAEVGLQNTDGDTAWDYAGYHENAKPIKQILRRAGAKEGGKFPWLNRGRKRVDRV